jgi:excisionase family DNA binding protein
MSELRKTTLTEGWESRLAEALRKEFDRAFSVTIEKGDGRVRIVMTEQDAGGPIMTVGDVACLLQVNRSVVRQMTKSRAQRGPHPIPFLKLGGKTLRFNREAVLRWAATIPTPVRMKKRNQFRSAR